jgi:uncharacterized repeat protein (TIGR01451 family)
MKMATWRRLAVGAVAVATAALAPAGAAGAAAAPAVVPQAGGGAVNGFATGDFLFLNALNTDPHLAQVSVSQSASAVSSGDLTTSDTLGQLTWDNVGGKLTGKNAYGHAAGISANLGQGSKTIPQAQLTIAEAASPPPSKDDTNIVDIPADPLLHATVQPDHAEANTTSADNFCVLGDKPISQGVADVADVKVLDADQVAPGFSLIDATGEVTDTSTEQLAPNGAGNFGLSSSSTLNTAQVTLFKGIDGAQTQIKILNPITLNAFAGGVPGTAKVTFGDANGKTPVVSITNGGNTQALTLDQLIGGGVTLHAGGLLSIKIGLQPQVTLKNDGTIASATADLVSIQVVGAPNSGPNTVGGPLGQLLNPVLGPVLQALDPVLQQINDALVSAGITQAADLRVGHFEASSEVPQGGITCGLPVTKTVDKDPVQAGDNFTYTIRVDNPYDCTLTNVKVTDTITGSDGVLWTVTGTHPPADTQTNSKLVWNDIGPIKSGDSSSVSIDVTIPANSAAGKFTDHATATGDCATGSASGGTGITNATLTGTDTLNGPGVTAGGGQGGGGQPLADTGVPAMLGFAAGLLLLAGLGVLAIRRRALS